MRSIIEFNIPVGTMAKHTPLKQKTSLTRASYSNAQPQTDRTSLPPMRLSAMTTTGWQHSHQRAQQAQQKMLRIRARPSAHKKINKPGTPTPSGGSPTQRLGKYYEQRAAQFLRRQGYQILHQQRHRSEERRVGKECRSRGWTDAQQ